MDELTENQQLRKVIETYRKEHDELATDAFSMPGKRRYVTCECDSCQFALSVLSRIKGAG